MSELLRNHLEAATAHYTRAYASRGVGGGASGGFGGTSTIPYGGMSTAEMGGGARNQSVQTHAEQYRHFQGWVFAAVRAIAQRIAGQPLRVAVNNKTGAYTGSGVNEDFAAFRPQVTRTARRKARKAEKNFLPGYLKGFSEDLDVLGDHPLIEAVKSPNPVMRQWHLIYNTVVSLEITGKAYWWFHRAEGDARYGPEGNETFQIWPVPSSWIEPVHKPEQLFAGWKLRPGGRTQQYDIPAEQICYMYYPDPSNPLSALSPLSAIARAVIADESIAEAQRRSFANGLFPGHAIVMGRHPDINGQNAARPSLTKDQRRQVIDAFKQMYRGVLSYDEPIILDAYVEDIKKVSNSVRDMDFMQSGEYTKQRILQGFGVNSIILGQVEGANRASSANADDHFCKTCVNPKIELMSQCLTGFFAPLFQSEGEDLVVFVEPAKAQDPDLEMQEEKHLSDRGAMKVNELRARHGLPPLAPEFGDVVYLPPTLVPVPIRLEGETITAPPFPELQPLVKPPEPPVGAAGGPGGPKVKPGEKQWDLVPQAWDACIGVVKPKLLTAYGVETATVAKE